MYFTGTKFQSNDLNGRGDIVIFVLLCKIIHSFMQANMQIIYSRAKTNIPNVRIRIRFGIHS